MDTKKLERKLPSPARPRVPLTDISNSPALSTCKISSDNAFSSQLRKGHAVQLQQELEPLKKALKEKEEIIAAQKRNMEKLWLNYIRKSRQNEDIIQHNGQLYKDLMQTRDKLKILQHENVQMAAVHIISKSELQLKLTEALDHVKHLEALLDTSGNEKASSDKQLNAPSVLTKFLDSCVASGESKLDCSGESALAIPANLTENFEYNPVLCCTKSRRRESICYKEPSLKEKTRQKNSAGGSSCQRMPRKIRDGYSMVEGLHKVSENEDVTQPASSISNNSLAEFAQEISPLRFGTVPPSEENAATSATSPKPGKARHTQSMSTTDSVDLSCKNSTDRPLRRAVSSVGSYKEPPLNTKMRRPD